MEETKVNDQQYMDILVDRNGTAVVRDKIVQFDQLSEKETILLLVNGKYTNVAATFEEVLNFMTACCCGHAVMDLRKK